MSNETPSMPIMPPETASDPTYAAIAATRHSMQDAAKLLADLVNKEVGTEIWVGMPGEQAFSEMLRGVEEIVRQRDVAVKALADGIHAELAPATADLLGKRVMSADRIREFFEDIKHGEPDHIEWLREKFKSFWGVEV